MNDEYLWDRSGQPDSDVARLEALLSRYRMQPAPAPQLSDRPPRRTLWYAAAGLAAALALVAVALSFRRSAPGWRVMEAGETRTMATGQTISTAAGAQARLVSAAVGTIDLGENTTITVTELRPGRNTLELSRGTIHARTTSPPGVFVVDTPRARATDLGCEYTLSVEPGGEGRLHVDSGWVGLTRSGRQSLVPASASALFDREGRLMPPVFDDAPPGFFDAVRELALDAAPERRETSLATVLTLARRRDALTLLNLFPIATREERLRIYDRLNVLVPAPASIPRGAMEDWRMGSTDPWWKPVFEASEVRAIKKGKKPISSAR